MEEINLKELFQLAIKRWWILVVSAVVCAAAAGLVSFFVLDPVYQSDTTLYIGKNLDTKTDLAYTDVMLGSQLVKDYREIAKSKLVVSAVIKELGLKDITADQLSGKIDVSLKNDTRVIQITVQDTDPKMAMDVANKVADVFLVKAVDIMQVENVKVIDVAELPKTPVKPNKKMNVAIAFVLGLMVGAGIIFLLEYLDDTVKTPEDVKKYVDLPVIGTIPVFPEQGKEY